MSYSAPSPGLQPDDALPPVEPPTPGFILQLFIVPGVIVIVVVAIWVMFNWLAQMGNDRDAFVRALSRNNEARWQAAFNLANALRSERGSTQPRLTNDPVLAEKLAEILDREITASSMDKGALELRIYLSRALGEFRTPDALPTLVRAAITERSPEEAEVRRAALEGIALAATNASDKQVFAEDRALAEALLKASQDDDPRTRSVATVGMGVIGAPAMIERLHTMLADSYPDVRYNAATRLANRGDAAAIEVLEEMLDPAEQAGIVVEKQKELQDFKRGVITINALRAVEQLVEKNTPADLNALQKQVQALLAGTQLDPESRIKATEVLHKLQQRAVPALR